LSFCARDHILTHAPSAPLYLLFEIVVLLLELNDFLFQFIILFLDNNGLLERILRCKKHIRRIRHIRYLLCLHSVLCTPKGTASILSRMSGYFAYITGPHFLLQRPHNTMPLTALVLHMRHWRCTKGNSTALEHQLLTAEHTSPSVHQPSSSKKAVSPTLTGASPPYLHSNAISPFLSRGWLRETRRS